MTEEQAILENIGLVKSIVNRFEPKNRTEAQEMEQHGLIGLMKSFRKYDEKVAKFTTYCYRYVTWEILGYLRMKERWDTEFKPTSQVIQDYESSDDITAFFPKDLTD